MRKRLAIAVVLACVAGAAPSLALNNDDLAATLGMLWRLREPLCPSMTFDPEAFVKATKLPGGTAAGVRLRYRAAFQRGYAVATEWQSQSSPAEFCNAMEQFFDGKHDVFGNVKSTPEAPFPGLTIRR